MTRGDFLGTARDDEWLHALIISSIRADKCADGSAGGIGSLSLVPFSSSIKVVWMTTLLSDLCSVTGSGSEGKCARICFAVFVSGRVGLIFRVENSSMHSDTCLMTWL